MNAASDSYIVTVRPPGGKAPRRFLSTRFGRTWDNSKRVCYYAGSGQGGPDGGLPLSTSSVIEGQYTDYLVGGLFAHEFVYSQFEEDRCT